MKEWIRKSAVLLLVLVLAVASALGILVQRASIEADARTYDLVADYSDYQEMANQSDLTIEDWLEILAENGITKVGLYETNASALADQAGTDVSVELEKDITGDSDWQSKYPAELVALIEESRHYSDVLITIGNEADYQWILNAYQSRTEGIKMETVTGSDKYYIWIYGNGGGLTGEEWAEFPLGMWPDQVEMVEAAGLEIIPRTSTVNGQNGVKFAKEVLKGFEQFNAPYFMNSGKGILGFDDPEEGSKLLQEYLEKTGAAFIVTEQMTEQGNVRWDGDGQFLKDINYQSVRAFNEWSFIQCRYKYYNYDGPEEIANSLYRAIYERNCRVVYFKAILAEKMKDTDLVGNYITDPDEYVALISGLDEHMQRLGYTNETAVALPAYEPPLILKLMVGAGCAAAAIILLELFVALNTKVRYGLFGALLVCVIAALVVMPNTGKILLSMGGGAIMPCLASAGLIRYMRYSDSKNGRSLSSATVLGHAFCGTLAVTLISLCSAAFTSAALSETEYMLEVSLYRGVKIMQLIPLMVFFLSFVQVYILEKYAFGWEIPGAFAESGSYRLARQEKWKGFMDKPIRYREVFYCVILCAVLGMVGLMGIYYMTRTGNMNSEVVSSRELEFRNFLENTLKARPRTKEFLIGYPCMMTMIWAFRRRIPALPFFLGCGAVIGMTSIVNTLLHIRTPLALGFTRIMTGLAFGLIIGIIGVLVCEIVYRLFRKHFDARKQIEA